MELHEAVLCGSQRNLAESDTEKERKLRSSTRLDREHLTAETVEAGTKPNEAVATGIVPGPKRRKRCVRLTR